MPSPAGRFLILSSSLPQGPCTAIPTNGLLSPQDLGFRCQLESSQSLPWSPLEGPCIILYFTRSFTRLLALITVIFMDWFPIAGALC